ncbi:oxidative damage protection protein [Candidatus Profftella armatura]|uniref:Fe(II) trafficking protein YggX n=1 Tax=Candidatus Profftella armatura TaxID=669502 RepID=S5R8P8_9PROT|nr:oxidative damage protection protein [Candidatus Profftella armatura]AGS06970.1 Fe(II) trafficking protein YggX [Candidatus Profftella armatura]ALC96039.1 iron transporter [Candidatus Profftella armatura]QLK13871.1 oxidative damage protection protein [Candidatus Profftella armatura]
MKHIVNCIKLNCKEEGLDSPPFPGEIGEKIWKNVSKKAWYSWLKYQTMLINENRLNLSEVGHRKYLINQMKYYFFNNK